MTAGENVVRGVRHAAVCPKDGCGRREFFATREQAERWRCGEHGLGVVQENRPYTVKPTG